MDATKSEFFNVPTEMGLCGPRRGLTFPALLVGRRIQVAERIHPWLHLRLDDGREVYVAGGRVRLDLECPRCREFRLTEIVETAGKQEGVCAVCCFVWKIEEPSKEGTGQ